MATAAKTLKRQDKEYKEKEQGLATAAKRLKRQEKEYKEKERRSESAWKRLKRQDDDYRKSGSDKQKLYQLKKNPKNVKELIALFHERVAQGPTFVCQVCQQLSYRKSVNACCNVKLPQCEAVDMCLQTADINDGYVCLTCVRYLKKCIS